MKKVMPILASTLALTSFASVAQAQDWSTNESGLYVGGNYGYLKVDGDDDFDDNNDVWQGLIGYRFNQYMALEGGYTDFGSYGSDIANAETDGYSAAVKGILPLTESIEFFAKAGQVWYDTDYSVAGFKGSSDDEALFAGAGFNFKLSDQLLLNAQYTWYDADLSVDEAADDIENTDFDTNFNQASVGVEYRF
ncbi:outer membrane protein A [Marinomonas gallaica]|uniref:Outer membrane protein A n=1 Tax=Marinomonas gallaica TaxID=1806667 RepID=A0A1C3JQR5_9GAMM|nr:porin family protein [Marinomonas gallaica]SBT17568.1 outer membrane protein A [Marinomonas gallaica]SBT19760.1 outer membrane protein A [Marinomonas gallaica]